MAEPVVIGSSIKALPATDNAKMIGLYSPSESAGTYTFHDSATGANYGPVPAGKKLLIIKVYVSDGETSGYGLGYIYDSGSLDSATGNIAYRAAYFGENNTNFQPIDIYATITAGNYPNWNYNKTGMSLAIGVEIDA